MARIDRVLARLYRRLGGRYFQLMVAAPAVNAVPGIAFAILGLAQFTRPTSGYLIQIAAMSVVASAGVIGIVWFRVRIDGRRVLEWPGDPSAAAAPEAWYEAAGLPQRLVFRGVVGFALAFVPVTVWGAHLLHYPFAVAATFYVLILVAIIFSATLDYFSFELMLRPVRREIAEHLAKDFQSELRVPTLRTKLSAVIFVVSLVNGITMAATQVGSYTPIERLQIGVAVAVLVAALVGMVPVSLLVDSLRTSIASLTRAAQRVEGGDLTATVRLVAVDETAPVALSFNRMTAGLREREALQSAMGAYVDPVIAKRVLTEGHRLSGEAADVTIMFVDIVGFTALAEDAIPEEVVSDLNDFFALVVPVIERHCGHANKLLGDGLMAVFGVPIPLDHHGDHALAAAREIDQALAERYDGQLRAGIGLNSGTVVVGSMGGGRKLDYTVIGDPVNVAARVEALTRQTGDSILLTEATRQALSDPSVQLVERGSTPVKGRKQQVALYTLPNGRNRDADPLISTGR
ncbi:MAG: hypothetical protein NVSMB51_01230 [Solirubrobacteraceae bacterium]